ncbi:RNA polymerase sigma factor [Chondromyces apiculatus]|uniref:Uncharacterized protein n=1 Tax=Chondromyces apiculatus DSM 436 TaxID=1192034 RepID=A0A017TI52_9BACT|nr:RNA polymerase sigma factor [Chondromyces apiculatus]EYF08958.1 Hypothetical protein CAP_0042 [Chondromyces apiculatus DSM 436]
MACRPLEQQRQLLIPEFDTVYSASVAFVRQSLRWLGVAEQDLDDVLQEVMLAAYRALPRFDPERAPSREQLRPEGTPATAGSGPRTSISRGQHDPLKCWLFGIARRQASHYRERAHRRREVTAGAGASWPLVQPDAGPNSEQIVALEQRTRLVSALLERLSAERRVILVMADLLEIPPSEIALELQINEATVRSRLRLARQDFRMAVKRLNAEQRRALSPADLLTASERRVGLSPDTLLREARVIPDVPEGLRVALWSALRRQIVDGQALLKAQEREMVALA